MNGFHTELTKNIIGLNGDIIITPMYRTIDNYQAIKTKLQKQNYIKHITIAIQGQVLAIGKSNNSGAILKAINLQDLRFKNAILQNVNFGSFDSFSGKNVVALGASLASNLGVTAGDKVKLISPNTISTAFGSMPRAKGFKVIAIFTSGMYDYDSASILMPLEAAQNFLSLGNNINLIEVNTKHPVHALLYSAKIQKLL